MRRIFGPLLCVCVLLGLTGSNLAGGKDDAGTILDKAIKAHGGDKLSKFKAHTWKTKGTIELFGMKQAYQADYFFQQPDKLSFVLTMNAEGKDVKLVMVCDGKTAWEAFGPMMREMEKEKLEEVKHTIYTHHVTQLTPLKEEGFILSALGESKVGDKAALGIKVARKGNREVSLFFDKETGLLAKIQTRVIDEFIKKEVPQDTLVSGYRDKEGIKVFDRVTIMRDGKVFIEEAVSDQRPLEKLDEKVFAKPMLEGK